MRKSSRYRRMNYVCTRALVVHSRRNAGHADLAIAIARSPPLLPTPLQSTTPLSPYPSSQFSDSALNLPQLRRLGIARVRAFGHFRSEGVGQRWRGYGDASRTKLYCLCQEFLISSWGGRIGQRSRSWVQRTSLKFNL